MVSTDIYLAVGDALASLSRYAMVFAVGGGYAHATSPDMTVSVGFLTVMACLALLAVLFVVEEARWRWR